VLRDEVASDTIEAAIEAETRRQAIRLTRSRNLPDGAIYYELDPFNLRRELNVVVDFEVAHILLAGSLQILGRV
jgi:hypothetical protein